MSAEIVMQKRDYILPVDDHSTDAKRISWSMTMWTSLK